MADFDNNLDALLTTDEEMPVVDEAPANADEPTTNDVDPDETAEERTPTDETGSDEAPLEQGSEAGSQPDNSEETSQQATDGVPPSVVADLRRERRELRQQNLELMQRLERVEQNQQAAPEQQDEDGYDDDEPLTRADLRRIERERIEKANQQTQQQTAAKVRNALLLAEPAQERLLQIAERYLLPADRQAITQSDNILDTATTLARARLNAYGSESEVAWLERNFPAQEATPRQPSPNQRHADRPSKRKAQAPSEEAANAPARDDLPGNARSVVDHMFA